MSSDEDFQPDEYEDGGESSDEASQAGGKRVGKPTDLPIHTGFTTHACKGLAKAMHTEFLQTQNEKTFLLEVGSVGTEDVRRARVHYVQNAFKTWGLTAPWHKPFACGNGMQCILATRNPGNGTWTVGFGVHQCCHTQKWPGHKSSKSGGKAHRTSTMEASCAYSMVCIACAWRSVLDTPRHVVACAWDNKGHIHVNDQGFEKANVEGAYKTFHWLHKWIGQQQGFPDKVLDHLARSDYARLAYAFLYTLIKKDECILMPKEVLGARSNAVMILEDYFGETKPGGILLDCFYKPFAKLLGGGVGQSWRSVASVEDLATRFARVHAVVDEYNMVNVVNAFCLYLWCLLNNSRITRGMGDDERKDKIKKFMMYLPPLQEMDPTLKACTEPRVSNHHFKKSGNGATFVACACLYPKAIIPLDDLMGAVKPKAKTQFEAFRRLSKRHSDSSIAEMQGRLASLRKAVEYAKEGMASSDTIGMLRVDIRNLKNAINERISQNRGEDDEPQQAAQSRSSKRSRN